MPKCLKIAPDPDARVCHCGDGNPDCDHWESCDGCGMDYRKHEGHDCIDGVPVQDLRALAKELRDSLDACETERDRLRAELDAAHDGEDALRSEVDRLRAQVAVIKVEEFRREDRYVVLKRTDLERHATPAQLRDLERTCGMVRAGRVTEGKRINSYVVVADDWPEYKETWAKIQARVTGIPQPLQPEELRVGPGEVVVGREEWEAVQEFADLIVPIRDNLSGISWIGKLSDVFAAYDRWYAVRTSAQAHNGEESK